jgi:O-antigen/teichoic acid export membrane protein
MRRLPDKLPRLSKSEFLKDVLKLVFGTFAGRAITLLALPIVTRLYSPEDFGILAAYLSLVNMLFVAACFRFEVAIPLADDDEEAVNLLALSLLSLGFVSAAVTTVILTFPAQIGHWFRQPEIIPYLWLVPLGVLMSGSYAAFQNWATRARRFGSIARTRVGQALAGVGTMISLGWIGMTPLGLLLGNALNTGSGGFSLGLSAILNDRNLMDRISLNGVKRVFRKYHHYLLYSSPESILNMASVQVPILLIAAHSSREAGFLLLSMQVMTTPMTLLGTSIGQVYVSRAPEECREGRLASFTASIMRRLLFLGTGPLVIVGISAPVLFPFFFGNEWARAGVIVAWLVPWMILHFVTWPVSNVMFVVERQRTMLALTVFGVVIRAGSVLFAIAEGRAVVETFAVSSALYYLVCCAVYIDAANRGKPHVA